MRKATVATAALVLALMSRTAFAQEDCAAEVEEVEQAIAEEHDVTEENLLRARDLTSRGAELCAAGREMAAMTILDEARDLLDRF